MINVLLVGIGGFLGSVARYLIGLLPVEPDSGFPIKTLLINVVGAFLIGIIIAFADKNKTLNPQVVLMLKVGFCGGFTTFSTFAYETSDLISSGKMGIAVGYACLSCILSILAVFGAQMIIK